MERTHNDDVLRKVLRRNKKAQETYEGLPAGVQLALLHHLQSGYKILFDEVLKAVDGNELQARLMLHTILTGCLNNTFAEVRALVGDLARINRDEGGYPPPRVEPSGGQ